MKQLDIFDVPAPSPIPHEHVFYNTPGLAGKELHEAEKAADRQERYILQIFKESQMLAPSEVWQIYQEKHGAILLTSTRRSITNLTNQLKLIKTAIRHKGPYGRSEFVWKWDDQSA